jgi:type VI secretion system protein VasJ
MSAAVAVQEPLRSLASPFPGDTPCGPDLSGDEVLDRLGLEIDKLTTLAAAGTPDWNLVRSETTRVLQTQSKHLRVAGWWVLSKAALEGWQGACEGLEVYQALVTGLWEKIHPPAARNRLRVNLVESLWGGLLRVLGAREVESADADAVRRLAALVPEVEGFLEERLGFQKTEFGKLRETMRERSRVLPVAVPAPAAAPLPPAVPAASGTAVPAVDAVPTPAAAPLAPVSPPSPTPAPQAAPAVAPPSAVPEASSLSDAIAVARQWRTPLGALARQARRAAPSSPWPYRAARMSAWFVIVEPPKVEAGKTLVKGPRPDDRTRLARLAKDGPWAGLRDAAEEALAENIFWLDLHRYTALALERLGAENLPARDAVARDLLAFLDRVPGLPSLVFANGSPFAEPETVDWIASERERLGGPVRRSAPVAVAVDDTVAPLIDGVRACTDGAQFNAGLEDALRAASSLATARARFQARLALAKLAETKGKALIALALYDRLLPEVDATLETWEPALCAEFLEAYVMVLRKSARKLELEMDTSLLRRLLILDPAAALRVG